MNVPQCDVVDTAVLTVGCADAKSKRRGAASLLAANLAQSDDGSVVAITHPDFDAIDRDVFGFDVSGDDSDLDAEEMQAALKFVRQLLAWVCQNGMRNPEGVQIRALIVCWVLLEYLHPLTETQLARGYGKHKQSFGRWIDDFKVKFPKLRNPHMKG